MNHNIWLAIVLIHLLIAALAELLLNTHYSSVGNSNLIWLTHWSLAAHSDAPTRGITRSLESVFNRLVA